MERHDNMPVMGLPIDIDPMDALVMCVRIASGEVAYATMQVHRLEEADAVGPMRTRRRRPLSRGKDGESATRRVTETTAHGVELNIWIRTRAEAMDRLARYSKMALDAGIAEKQVDLAEQYGAQIAVAFQVYAQELRLTDEQQKRSPAALDRALRQMEQRSLAMSGFA